MPANCHALVGSRYFEKQTTHLTTQAEAAGRNSQFGNILAQWMKLSFAS